MSLAPSTDLVLEVSRAADPARAAAVTEKLNALSRQGAASPQDFASALEAAAPPKSSAAAASPVVPRPFSAAGRAEKAKTQLESVFLGQFIEEMLPKDTPSAFGQGYAGDMWRQMLAERVADQLAASGRIGLASRLFATHPLPGASALGAPDKALGGAHVTQMSANTLSTPADADVEQGSVLFPSKASL